ncbi:MULTISPECIES: HAMP domain-containing sensor histidine kinase [unclassified Methanoregula]|uniref:sensor histidine kinase n=1 Tax=unclassified Methanoregula TaxID=2649730 RepID=UPI0009C7C933|nr:MULTISPECIES: HAMP domain-containing sensor histidine kinase [unclassified Methanoregula]OPX64009.1 MAG: sensory histidine kinase AtoS [Methanoregula sp. PtaB.Bin085]OPY33793.1 MAG: sensory histidine kinase AtoS [Methanoregula sp. PtaU1.Bin006]
MSSQGEGKETSMDPARTGGDDTDDKKTIAELTAKVAFLEKKLQLVGSVTRHDILNQMTAIVGYNELLSMMAQDPKFKSFLEKEKSALTRIRRQFQYAKDYQNIAVEPPRWHTLRNVVNRVSEDFDAKTVRVLTETGAAAVLADPLFERALHYLFDNAVQRGGTTTEIRVTLREQGPSGLLVVEDNCTGIPADDKEKIFERGFGKESGWGLFLAREILAVTGMTIRESGIPEKGARFEIVLPAGSFRMDGVETPR